MLRGGRTFYGIKLNGFEYYYVWCMYIGEGNICLKVFLYMCSFFIKAKEYWDIYIENWLVSKTILILIVCVIYRIEYVKTMLWSTKEIYIYIIQKIRDDFVILNDRFHESRDVSSENLQFYLN